MNDRNQRLEWMSGALWSKTAKNTDVSTGLLTHLFAHSLTHSLARGKVNFWCLKITWICPIVRPTHTLPYRSSSHLRCGSVERGRDHIRVREDKAGVEVGPSSVLTSRRKSATLPAPAKLPPSTSGWFPVIPLLLINAMEETSQKETMKEKGRVGETRWEKMKLKEKQGRQI